METTPSSTTTTSQINTNNSEAPPVLLNATLEDEKIYFTEEIVRLENSIRLLTNSNEILREQGDSDPDFILAIKENEEVIIKYEKIVENIRKRLDAISQSSCLKQLAGSNIDLSKGNSVSEDELSKNIESLKLTTQEVSSIESIPVTFNNSSEEVNEYKLTEKDTIKTENKIDNEDNGLFL
ncbi:hypothetical protein BCR36DRAFT_579322 [Piromyces finnis]|uniref:Uncharacterized protein n=1 Tax=Piromyces finnis TaxID=1754191 RepID=A0A1Y1VLR3_9FUNG|nr:hypothetical protein BCR36DRAFT_579322 [Piromyces finnis]|eukprot:ORX59873.1 hypothetical protein BCR36DRAFT_579322 [Piromyces finnis]